MDRDTRRVVEAKLRRRDREQGKLPDAFLDEGNLYSGSEMRDLYLFP